MFLRKLHLTILLFFYGMNALAFTSQPVEWSYLYLSRAANFLMVVADAGETRAPELCEMDSKKALVLNPFIHALLDEKKKKIGTAPLTAKLNQQLENCRSSCTCGYYADLLADLSSDRYKVLTKSAEEISTKEKQKCAYNFKDFCQSQLLKYLEQQAQENR